MTSCTAKCAAGANALIELGVKKGDRVAVYMPMIPEAILTMLAIVRLGAIHSVVFADSPPRHSLRRILDSDCTLRGDLRRRLSPRGARRP
jgi:acyl-coenzyme A synthetase/AMP-(fatty) acid ligase